MKILWKLSKEAIRYRTLYILAILATLPVCSHERCSEGKRIKALFSAF